MSEKMTKRVHKEIDEFAGLLGINPAILIDGYKVGHIDQYPKGTQVVFSNATARQSRMLGVDKMVLFGNQFFVKEILVNLWTRNFFNRPKEIVTKQYKRLISKYLFTDISIKHLEALHDLGYLPLIVMSLPEGSRVPMRVANTVFYNTLPEFYWLTNFFETIYSAQTWDLNTSATIAHEYRKVFDKYADETVGNRDFAPWQGHDFSFRGRTNWQSAMASGGGHLLSFWGTDTIPALWFHETYYGADVEKELIGGSVPATEHSVMCVGTGFYVKSEHDGDWEYFGEAELAVFKRLITEVYPSGIVSIVSDTWDFWKVITEYTVKLKDEILARDGKIVFRPDSGDPVKIICGDPDATTSYERLGAIACLWAVFGGTETAKGYKLLDSHVGLIYGDSITLDRQYRILEGLKKKGFCSFNVVLGIGSYTYNYNTRDTFGQAIKATYSVVNGIPVNIFKTPKTDTGMKNSAKGLLAVYEQDGTFVMKEEATWEEVNNCAWQVIFKDGEVYNETTLANIRKRLGW